MKHGAFVGLAAAALAVAGMFGLRLALDVRSLPDVAADGLTRLLPGSVFGLLIDRLQEYGRPLMLVGLAGALALLGAALGAARASLLASRRPAVRLAILALVPSALTVPLILLGATDDFAIPSLTTVGAWMFFALLVEGALLDPAPNPVAMALGPSVAAGTPATGGRSRRALLYGAGSLAAVWLGSYLSGRVLGATAKVKPASAVPAPTLPPLPPATPLPSGATPAPAPDPFAGLTGITTTKDFYVISKNGVDDPDVKVAGWRLQVGGARPYALSYDELRALPHTELPQTLACISNVVGGPLISTAIWRGVPLRDLIERAGPPAATRELRFSCADGYTESLPLDVAGDPRTIVAYLMNGEPLTKEHGFPARVITIGRYGVKNPKWLTGIVPVAQPYNGFWQQRGWSKDAIVRTFARLDYPQEQDVVAAGRDLALVRGVAYAGTRGIRMVEISVDGGRTWEETRLRRVLADDDWAFFTHTWRAPAPGTHVVVVRATDGEGTLQDPVERESFPDGATGYHHVKITVR